MRLELQHIHKHFGAIHANNDISLTIESGTIHGLLGENGAGKSTLMKILSGFIQRDAGEILLDGHASRSKIPPMRCAPESGCCTKTRSMCRRSPCWIIFC
jgi:ABC-type uncharacterized transport system ATPase subunit